MRKSLLKTSCKALAATLFLSGAAGAALHPGSALRTARPAGTEKNHSPLPKAQNPLKITAGAELYGIIVSVYPSDWANPAGSNKAGIAKIATDGSGKITYHCAYNRQGSGEIGAAGIGNTLYLAEWCSKTNKTVYSIIDLETGVQSMSQEYTRSAAPDMMCYSLSADPATGDIYGVFEGNYLAKVSFSAPSTVTKGNNIAQLSYCYDKLAINAQGDMYAVAQDNSKYNGQAFLVKIDKATGAETIVGPTGFVPKWSDGLCFDTAANVLYWTANNDDEGILASVDLTTGQATKLCEYSGGPELTALYIKQPPYVDPATPAATTATLTYTDGVMKVEWLPVNTNVGGEPLASDVTYTVTRFPGEVVVAENITATSFEEPIEETSEFIDYYYTITVNCGGLSSAPAQTDIVATGFLAPPFQSDFYNNGLDGMTVINANNDGNQWETTNLYTDNIGWIRIKYNSNIAMDDWTITPGFRLFAGKAYKLEFKVKVHQASYPERLEVKMGNAPDAEAMTQVLMPATVFANTTPELQSVMIVPEEDGTYYIGFHGCSDKDTYYLYLSDYTISAPTSAVTPEAVSDLQAVPGDNGALTATLSFKAPTKTAYGKDLTSISKIEVVRGEETVKTFENPAPGAELSFTDNLPAAGNATYTVTAYHGESAGIPAEVTLYVGFGKPNAPENVAIERTATPGYIKLSWEAPETDIDGRTFGPGALTYTIARFINGTAETVAQGITDTSYTFEAVAPGTQDFVQCCVFATSNGGKSESVNTELIAAGTPYTGFHETFPGGSSSYKWLTFTDNAQGVWKFDNDNSQDEGTSSICLYYREQSSYGLLTSGLISLEGMTAPQLTYWTYNWHEGNRNTVTVEVCKDGDTEFTPLDTKQVNSIGAAPNEWGRVKVDLSPYVGKTIQIRFNCNQVTSVYHFLDNISVGERLSSDVEAVSISVPAKVDAGEEYMASVIVANEGVSAASFTLRLMANNEEAGSQDIDQLAAGSRLTVEFPMVMSPVETEPVQLKAIVELDGDQDLSNNFTATVKVTPLHSNLPVVTGLVSEIVGKEVHLTWDKPVIPASEPETVTDDFEDGTPFADTYGDWIFVDVDKSPVGGFGGNDFPGIVWGETCGSFWVYDLDAKPNPFTVAPSGKKHLFSLHRADDGQADDWAISPVLSGNAQTVSFKAVSIPGAFTEKISVYYSTGSTDPADFILIEGVGGEVPSSFQSPDWHEYKVPLPEGAKRFAIRSWATGQMMLGIDDVTYEKGSPYDGVELTGYNVYRNGQKVAALDHQDGEQFVEEPETDTAHRYHLQAVYNTGVSAPSDPVTLSVSAVGSVSCGGISVSSSARVLRIAGAEGLQLTVADAAGRTLLNAVPRSTVALEVTPGVYIVRAGKTTRKIIVK